MNNLFKIFRQITTEEVAIKTNRYYHNLTFKEVVDRLKDEASNQLSLIYTIQDNKIVVNYDEEILSSIPLLNLTFLQLENFIWFVRDVVKKIESEKNNEYGLDFRINNQKLVIYDNDKEFDSIDIEALNFNRIEDFIENTKLEFEEEDKSNKEHILSLMDKNLYI